ncbi:MAG: hypothetical protein V4760_00320 [Bdellovibrionota bacterium]
MSDRSRLFLKVALSGFIAYHVFCVALLPNSASIIGRKLDRILTPYANPFIFNRTWQFFSPGPMPSFYIEYEVVTPESEMDLNRATIVYPPVPKSFTLGDYYLRSLAGMRFLGVKDENFTKFFVPYLCRQHAGAIGLDIRSVMEEVPQMESLDVDSTIGFKELAEKKDLPRKFYECPGAAISMKGDIEEELKTLGDETGDGSGGQPQKNDPAETIPGGDVEPTDDSGRDGTKALPTGAGDSK